MVAGLGVDVVLGGKYSFFGVVLVGTSVVVTGFGVAREVLTS